MVAKIDTAASVATTVDIVKFVAIPDKVVVFVVLVDVVLYAISERVSCGVGKSSVVIVDVFESVKKNKLSNAITYVFDSVLNFPDMLLRLMPSIAIIKRRRSEIQFFASKLCDTTKRTKYIRAQKYQRGIYSRCANNRGFFHGLSKVSIIKAAIVCSREKTTWCNLVHRAFLHILYLNGTAI